MQDIIEQVSAAIPEHRTAYPYTQLTKNMMDNNPHLVVTVQFSHRKLCKLHLVKTCRTLLQKHTEQAYNARKNALRENVSQHTKHQERLCFTATVLVSFLISLRLSSFSSLLSPCPCLPLLILSSLPTDARIHVQIYAYVSNSPDLRSNSCLKLNLADAK